MKPIAGPLLMLAVLMSLVARGDETADKGKSYWMKKKLEYAQNILSGLAVEDFEVIGKNARAMNTLSALEKWVHGKSTKYRTQLDIFRYANEELIRQADQDNLDGCSVAYMQLTLSCIHCHRVVRDLDRPGKPSSSSKD